MPFDWPDYLDLARRLAQADVVRLHSLRARIDSDPAELPFLVRLFAHEIAGPGEASTDVSAFSRLRALHPGHPPAPS